MELDMDCNKLIEYVAKIYELETSVFQQQQLYETVSNEIDSLNSYEGEAFYEYESKPHFCEDYEALMGLSVMFAILFGIGSVIIFYNIFRIYSNFWDLIIGVLISAVIGFLIPLVVCLIRFIIRMINCNRTNNEIDYENDLIEKHNNEIFDSVQKQIDTLQTELELISKQHYETKDILEKYYSLNIIFPKYRSLIPISSFYEYLLSGKCSKLEGFDGAYNIYDNENLQKIIITKLDVVIEQLESINSNQLMLFSAINKSNNMVENLSEQIFSSAQNLEVIAENSAVSAYNSQLTAENTEFLKWITLFNA